MSIQDCKIQADRISNIHSSLMFSLWFSGALYWYFTDTDLIYAAIVCMALNLLINLSSILSVSNIYKYHSLVEQTSINNKLSKLLSQKENGL
ncbi:hypothetical protein [Pseudocolwellia agarivorans]|jgi:hypothetical protein|uniref:hypothetical protein n=1 Tax=Pseudocolwellia agarivorans TaxID=1911682 RepID=UPI003F885BA5